MDFRRKIIPYAELEEWRGSFGGERAPLVVTNGCFDLLHLGHVAYLQEAANLGRTLLVGVNGDAAVRELKGAARPLNPEMERASVLAALESVAHVCVFPGVRATEFLSLARPQIYVKGGDYTLETINQEERKAVESHGGMIAFIPFVQGKSTSGLVEKIQRL